MFGSWSVKRLQRKFLNFNRRLLTDGQLVGDTTAISIYILEYRTYVARRAKAAHKEVTLGLNSTFGSLTYQSLTVTTST